MAMEIKHRRGLKKDLPELSAGELAYALDTRELFIGNEGDGNTQVATVDYVAGQGFVKLEDIGGGGGTVSQYVYKCTGTNDNVAICEIINRFFDTDDGAQNLKLSLEGVMGVDDKAFGDGSSGNPWKVFCEENANDYGKKVVIDGGNCTFPSIKRPSTGYIHYFNMKNTNLENVAVEIGVNTSGDSSCFFNCSNLNNCTGVCGGDISTGVVTQYTSCAFENCSNLTNCTGVSASTMGEGHGFNGCFGLNNCVGTSICDGAEGYAKAFNSCSNLSNCTGESKGSYWGHGFYSCSNLSNCTGVGSTSGNSYNYGFHSCSNLSNCTGVGELAANSYGFHSCSNLSNCTGESKGSYSYGFFGCSKLDGCVGIGESTGSKSEGYGFRDCDDLCNCKGTGTGDVYGRGFTGCNRLSVCEGCGYAKGDGGGGFFWNGDTSNIAVVTNCTAPIRVKEGYKQTYGIHLDGTTSGARYCLVGNVVASDSGSFVGIRKHTVTGVGYTEIGTIRANI